MLKRLTLPFKVKKIILFIICTTAIFYTACNTLRDSKKSDTAAFHKKKIVFIAGGASHGTGEHEFKDGCTLLAGMLNENVANIDAVVYDTHWPADTSALQNADAVVVYCDGGEGHMIIPHLEEVKKLMDKGVGLVLLHYAVEIPKGEKGNYFLNWIGGYFETYWSVNPYWKPTFEKLPQNEITQGVKPFSIDDEWYYHMRFAEDMKNITPILVALPPKQTLDRPDGSHENNAFVREDIDNGIPQTMAWSFNRPNGGRGFGFTGGHMHRNWMNDDFRKLVLNAIVWAAKAEVPKGGVRSLIPSNKIMDSLQNMSGKIKL